MTMNALDTLNSLVAAAIETQDVDMTETAQGGAYEDVLLPKGEYYGYFTEYVEIGKRLPTKGGKPTGKPAAANVRIGVVVYGPNGEVKRIRPYPMTISNFERAGFKKFFDKLNYDGNIKHAAQRLGQAFVFPVDEHTSAAGKKSNIVDLAAIRPIPKFDPNTGEPITMPALDASEIKLFLWNNPTKETWDSLHIDGTFDDGKSKNWIQEDMYKAVDFPGSALDILLNAGSVPSPQSMQAPAAPAAPAAPVAPSAPVAPAAPTAPVAPVAPVAPAAPAAPQA